MRSYLNSEWRSLKPLKRNNEESSSFSVRITIQIPSFLPNDISRKNVTKGYSDAQVKVRKATSNEAWGPEGADMAEIAQMTFDRYTTD